MSGSVERLPWVKDEPRPEPATLPPFAGLSRQPPERTGGRPMWPWYLALSLLIAAVGAVAWWLGFRQAAPPPPQLPVEESVAQTPAPVAVPAPLAPPAPAAEPVTAEPEPERRRETEAPRSAPGRNDAAERERRRLPPVAKVVEQAANPQAALVRANPNSGRVVQLGAFPTRPQAEEAWSRVTRRYPYLKTRTKMINTVEVRALGGGRRTRMYRLQLGTSSQAQSVVICQQLEKAGQSCVVVY